MLLFVRRKGAPGGERAGFAEMKQFAGGLASRGALPRGGPPEAGTAGARVRGRADQASVREGPFGESKEVMGGFWIGEATSREEAIDIARRCPHARHGAVEVHAVQ